MTTEVSQIGICQPSKTKTCNTKMTRYIRSAEPKRRDTKKSTEPVLWASFPILEPKYSYTEVTFNL